MTAMIFHDEECWHSMISSQQMQYEQALWACAQKGNDRMRNKKRNRNTALLGIAPLQQRLHRPWSGLFCFEFLGGVNGCGIFEAIWLVALPLPTCRFVTWRGLIFPSWVSISFFDNVVVICPEGLLSATPNFGYPCLGIFWTYHENYPA